MKSTLRNMLISLSGLSVLAGLALGVTYKLTEEPIAKAKDDAKKAAIAAILPHFEDLEAVCVSDKKIYIATQGGNPVGVAVETFSDAGFSGRIDIMAGFDTSGRVTGYKVLSHAETPGLGARMDEWFHNSQVIGSDKVLRVRADGGDVDAITGATITSRAFTEAINNAREAFKLYCDESK